MAESESLPAYFERRTAELAASELQEYEALAYEIWMLGEIVRLASGPANWTEPIKNALV